MASLFVDIQPSLCQSSLAAIDSLGFSIPTPVQQTTIPLFLSNKDVCVQATTGSGKTLAFVIPMFEIISRLDHYKKGSIYGLVIAPTRELAEQIHSVILKFTEYHSTIKSVLLIGGTGVQESIQHLSSTQPQIAVGTPGRIMDLISRKVPIFILKLLEILILDEADTLLDLGFKETLNQILSNLPKLRRTGLFSATQTNEVKELARAGMRNPVTIVVKVQSTQTSTQPHQQLLIPSTLANYVQVCEYHQRLQRLMRFIQEHSHSKLIIFCATCSCVDFYSSVFVKLLAPHNIAVVGLHGKMVPKKRNGFYRKYVALEAGVLFSTDVAARGIDIPDVDWIIQLAAPKDPSFFIHRIGRTARAGRSGGALLYVSEAEKPYIELLRGRHVPLIEQTVEEDEVGASEDVLEQMKQLAMTDREVLEKGSTAFMAFLRAYQEHLCSYIFRLDDLDIGSVARSYGLLRLPKIPETRRKKGKPIVFENSDVNTSLIPYHHVEKEQARQNKLLKLREEKSEQEEIAAAATEAKVVKKEEKREWNPEYEMNSDPKRKRKKKVSKHKEIMDEWDELAAEETLFRKFKKGKVSAEEYEELLFSEDVKEVVGKAHVVEDNEDESASEREEEAMHVHAARISSGDGGGRGGHGNKKVFAKGDFRKRNSAPKKKGSNARGSGGKLGGRRN